MGAGRDTRYGLVYSEKLHDGEPLFIFRAADEWAITGMMRYAALVDSQDVINRVKVEMQRFQQWQIDHPELVKEPD